MNVRLCLAVAWALCGASSVFAQDKAQGSTPLDSVQKITAAIQEIDEARTAIRSELRRLSAEISRTSRDLSNDRAQIETLLSAMMDLRPDAAATTLIHPAGALDQVRAGMSIAGIVPGLTDEAAMLNDRLRDLSDLQATHEVLLVDLADLATEADHLRRALRHAKDTEVLGLGAKKALLENRVDALAGDFEQTGTPGPSQLPTGQTRLRLPAEGEIVSVFTPDRHGLFLRTEPHALVTSPIPATVRFSGFLKGRGTVIILEPAPDHLIVLADLGEILVESGQIVPKNAPLAFMPGPREAERSYTIPIEMAIHGGRHLSDALYIEVRKGNRPVDPALWFDTEKD